MPSCEVCDKSFDRTRNLDRHVQDVHHNRLRCNHCKFECGSGWPHLMRRHLHDHHGLRGRDGDRSHRRSSSPPSKKTRRSSSPPGKNTRRSASPSPTEKATKEPEECQPPKSGEPETGLRKSPLVRIEELDSPCHGLGAPPYDPLAALEFPRRDPRDPLGVVRDERRRVESIRRKSEESESPSTVRLTRRHRVSDRVVYTLEISEPPVSRISLGCQTRPDVRTQATQTDALPSLQTDRACQAATETLDKGVQVAVLRVVIPSDLD